MNAANATDDELMQAYAQGDQTAFAELYQRHRGPLYRFFRRQLSPHEADDCFQALWLKLIDQAPRYRPTGVFRSYVFTLAHNLLMDHFRRHSRERSLEAAPDDPAADGEAASETDGVSWPEADTARAELRQRLHELLARLPFHQREAWILKQESAMTVEEIAMVTRTSTEGVRSRLRYASGKLKAGLARYV